MKYRNIWKSALKGIPFGRKLINERLTFWHGHRLDMDNGHNTISVIVYKDTIHPRQGGYKINRVPSKYELPCTKTPSVCIIEYAL